jgi:hypothetical protein
VTIKSDYDVMKTLVPLAGDVEHSRDSRRRQPLPKLKENAIKQMAVIVSLSAKSFCCFRGSFVYRNLYCSAEIPLRGNLTIVVAMYSRSNLKQ